MREVTFIRFLFLSLLLIGCANKRDELLFKVREAKQTGLTFKNEIFISDTLNGVTFEYVYNGGGAAVGDVNRDGFKDLFFAGNMVSSRLYLNRGDLRFEDVTGVSGTNTKKWCTGVSMVDINDDGWLDIYICVAGLVDSSERKNIFFINQGNDKSGVPHFIDMAETMGLDDEGYNTMGAFLDYDKDLDLDLYLLTNAMEGDLRNAIRPRRVDGEAENTDRLYRNEGNGKFINVSRAAGILHEGYGLGVAVGDINQDGWTDIYSSNDFLSNDLLWINNQDGTFSEQSGRYFKHFTNNGMGMDMADYNNDGLLDVIVLDMMPFSNIRQKQMVAYRNSATISKSAFFGYHPQFLRNTLQLNLGKFADGNYRFSEIGYMAGVSQTDWSWAPLFADFDNDGWKDLLITNGYRKDVTNLDFIFDIVSRSQFGTEEANDAFMAKGMNNLKDVQLPNFLFKNSHDLTFSDKSIDWGVDFSTFSNGTIYADLDNDGDLEIVANNIDQEVTLYENRLYTKSGQKFEHHFITLRFSEEVKGGQRAGVKVWIFHDSNHQFIDHNCYRGYKSTVDSDIHFGLGNSKMVDSLVIQWPAGEVQKIYEIKSDTVVTIRPPSIEMGDITTDHVFPDLGRNSNTIHFEDVTEELGLSVSHVESDYSDRLITSTLLHDLSKYGPSLAIGDINGDGLDDAFMGSDYGHSAHLFIQQNDGKFKVAEFEDSKSFEDMGSLLFDADNDDDLDLYVVSGGSQWNSESKIYQDRLYKNNGLGVFTYDKSALPDMRASGSCVVAADYDSDGDLDLFVGGRLAPQAYPNTPRSFLLENTAGKFIGQSENLNIESGGLGMVTAALWTDVNNDFKPDLMVVGEWMPIHLFINEGRSFRLKNNQYGLKNTAGWWNSINGGDFDNDGDTDYVVGNYGLNSFFKASVEKPLEIYAKDFDNSGSLDPLVTRYVGDESYIVHPRNLVTELIPAMKYRFDTFEKYGNTPFEESFTKEELDGATHLSCVQMASVILENTEGTAFEIHELPLEAQVSPVYGTLTSDFNDDHLLDVFLIGNSMSEETITGYYDASYGTVLINKGDFNWEAPRNADINLIADGDKKALARVIVNDLPVYLATENDGYLQAFVKRGSHDGKAYDVRHLDWCYYIEDEHWRRKEEIYYGSGYLSSSSRRIFLTSGIEKVTLYNYSGEQSLTQLQ